LGFAFLFFQRLSNARQAVLLTALLTATFLSYTACLLFTEMVIAASVAILLARHRGAAMSLAKVTLAATVLAFFLYYVHWTLPFLTKSLPALAGGHTEAWNVSVVARLLAQPAKLAYSYGTVLVPLLGLLGLYLYRGRDERVILLAWAGVLVVFCGLDVFFNFLRKHHFFVLVPLEAGGGLALARLTSTGRAGRALAIALLLGAVALGAREALSAALALP